jgi:hypothetical protein
VHYVETQVGRLGVTHDGVEIGAIVIHERVRLMGRFGDLGYVGVEQTHGVGVGHHNPGHLVAQLFLERGRIHHAPAGRHAYHLVARDGSTGRVGAVSRVRHQDQGFFIALVLVIGGHEHDAG